MLEDKISYYKETGLTLYNTPAQYKNQFPWLKEVDSLSLCNEQLNLQSAYNKFFRDKSIGYPKFKTKKKSKLSYTTNSQRGFIKIIDNKYIRLRKLEKVKCKIHRQIPPTHIIKSVTITKTSSDKYYVSVLTEFRKDGINAQLDKNKILGLDYSSSSFYVDSQGVKADYPKFYRETERKLSKERHKLSKMEYGSNNYLKQKIKVAKLYEHITNQRKDWIHKLTTNLANTWDYICIEDIDLKSISKTLKLGKSTYDNGFGIFRTILKYKLEDRGKQLIKIDKWFPSSKMCNHCGHINSELTLSDREWICQCGKILDRDVNAAINIKNEGVRMITVGTTEIVC